MADAMIAGIAQAQALTIVTHNTKPFAPFGVGVATPDEALELA
jgi:predicted nucleic acid-binding protein